MSRFYYVVDFLSAGALVLMTVYSAFPVHADPGAEPKPAEPNVAAANRAVQSQLPFGDRQDFEDAMRGFIATIPDPVNPNRYAFLEHAPTPTVNRSLWRQAQLNATNGLFKVTRRRLSGSRLVSGEHDDRGG
jgi:alkyl sulfatase BDS1-like metallo-beta-lactamase superfamily hydrolase